MTGKSSLTINMEIARKNDAGSRKKCIMSYVFLFKSLNTLESGIDA